jgi:protein TonB
MMSNARRIPFAPRAACALALAWLLAACGGATYGRLPEKLGGLPESAPQRPAETMPFPNVYEPRPKRQAAPLNDDEQKKLESELTKLRDDQNQRATAPDPPPPPPEPAKKAAAPVKKDPAPAKKAAKEAAPVPAKKKQNDAVVPEQKGPVVPPKLIN